MTRVLASEMYEWPMDNETATCEDCGADIDVPDLDDPNGDWKAPHWRREQHFDVFDALCDECYEESIRAIIEG